MRAFRRLIDAIEAEGSAALVTLARVEGSSPREAGVRMVVRPSGGFHGTIGGGTLEFAALEASSPGEAGVRVSSARSGGFHGTIGGGTLEFAALEAASEALRRGRGPARRR